MNEPKTVHVSKNIDHLKPFESAARLYCKKIGADPDQKMPREHPLLAGQVVWFDQWRIVAEDLIDLSMKLSAMREAAELDKLLVRSH